MIKRILFLSMLLSAVSVHADHFYAGANYASFDLDHNFSFVERDLSLKAIYARAGYQLNEYLSAEVRAGTGVGKDELVVFNTENAEVDLNELFGGYLRIGKKATDYLYPYIIFGGSRGELDASIETVRVVRGENDFSYGAGIDFSITESIQANIEYMSYLEQQGVKLSGISFGLAVLF